MVQTFAVFTDYPATAKIKTAKSLTAQSVAHYAGLCRKNKNGENFFWKPWWHFHKSLHLQKSPAIRYDSIRSRRKSINDVLAIGEWSLFA